MAGHGKTEGTMMGPRDKAIPTDPEAFVGNFLGPSGCRKHPGTSDFHPRPKNWSGLHPNEKLMHQISISRSSRLTSRCIRMHRDGKNHPGTVCVALCGTTMHPEAPRKFPTFFKSYKKRPRYFQRMTRGRSRGECLVKTCRGSGSGGLGLMSPLRPWLMADSQP